jgi:hypothetical protein
MSSALSSAKIPRLGNAPDSCESKTSAPLGWSMAGAVSGSFCSDSHVRATCVSSAIDLRQVSSTNNCAPRVPIGGASHGSRGADISEAMKPSESMNSERVRPDLKSCGT